MLVFFSAALLLWQAAAGTPATPSSRDFRYQRTVTVPSGPGPSCAVIDPAIFPHAGSSLRDLRLYQDGREVPYAITLSEPQQPDTDTAQVRHVGLRGREIVFDVEMPHRPYTDVNLDLAGRDFIAAATVSGTRDANYTGQTGLGRFTIFDLTSQRLSRSTTLALQETDLPYLHIELAVSPAPGARAPTPQSLLTMVRGVTVPPSRDAQSLYTTAAAATTMAQRGRRSIATFTLAERIPVERVSFDLAPGFKGNFSRDVRITDHPDSTPESTAGSTPGSPSGSLDEASETVGGTILRVHLGAGFAGPEREIRRQQLSVPAVLGSNMQSPATVQVAVENGEDAPLPIAAVRLEMRQRQLCFDARSNSPLTLFYGDPELNAPQYDYARLWRAGRSTHTAQTGPEQLNPAYRTPPDMRPLSERHPRLLWMVLPAVLGVLGLVAVRSSKGVHRP